jgi:hypothetical protein
MFSEMMLAQLKLIFPKYPVISEEKEIFNFPSVGFGNTVKLFEKDCSCIPVTEQAIFLPTLSAEGF